MLLTGGDPDDVSGSDVLDGVTPSLDAADPGRDDQDLSPRMGVPGRAGTGLEGDRPTTRVRGIARLEQHLDLRAAGEVLRRRGPDGP